MKALLEAVRPGKDWELAQAIDPARCPAHIAIIMDGNGRWAGRRRLPRVAGHKAGIGPVRSTVETCARLGVKALTLYAFSVENWKRPRPEVETLWRLLRYYLKQELPDLQKNDIRLQAIGRLEALPAPVRGELDSAVEATANNRGLLVNLAINYGGRAEIVDAVNSVLEMARLDGSIDTLKIDEDLIATNLYTAACPDPDLLIRTSGEMRISNFLLWQIAYAELYVTETLWPDFTRTDLLQAVLEYQKRDRRYGGLSGAGERRPPSARRTRSRRSATPVMKRVLTAAALIPVNCYVVLWANYGSSSRCWPPWPVCASANTTPSPTGLGFGSPGPLGYGAGLALLFWTANRGCCSPPPALSRWPGHARRQAGRSAAARRPAGCRRGLHLRRLAMRHAAARGQPALADVRAAGELDGRYRRLLCGPQLRPPQDGAAREPQEILGRRGGVGGVVGSAGGSLPGCFVPGR